MRIILIDNRESFISDTMTRLIIADDTDVEVIGSSTKVEDLYTMVENHKPDAIVIADDMAELVDNLIFPSCKTAVYNTSANITINTTGVILLGKCSNSMQLLEALEKIDTAPVAQPVQPPQPPQVAQVAQVQQPPQVAQVQQPPQPIQQPQQTVEQTQQAYTPQPIPQEPVQQAPIQSTVPVQEPASQPNIVKPPVIDNELPQIEVEPIAPTIISQQTQANKNAENTKKQVLQDIIKEKKKTRVVTVYAAKGGVGKTTISSELAVALANTSVGRERLRVCIIDLNIDFGDVLTTLNYDARGTNLSLWANEVREELKNGKTSEEITYTKAEIESRLQLNQYGLYALIAPITHEDSMDIEGEEVKIIVENIINNGDFDFVICDTGNNTRDSSVVGLEYADTVLLLATQEVNSASCNSAFLNTMKKIAFDTSKIRLVINSVMPYKITKISVTEVEDMFPYECIARIKRTTDIIAANNRSVPLVIENPNHEFSQGIRQIVGYLLGTNTGIVQKKKGFFEKLFKK